MNSYNDNVNNQNDMNDGMNNSFLNNMNNQNSLNNNSEQNVSNMTIGKKEKNVKNIIMIVGILIALFLALLVVIKLVKGGGGSSSSINNTLMSGYNASDVAFRCEIYGTDSEKSTKTIVDIVFNKGYQMKTYKKMVITYSLEVTDENWESILNTLNSTKCVSLDSNLKNDCLNATKLELGTTKFGYFDTIVERKNNTITVTGYDLKGKGGTLSSSQQIEIKNEYMAEGATCKELLLK